MEINIGIIAIIVLAIAILAILASGYVKASPNKAYIISGIKRISKPGLRVYAGKEELPRVLGGLGIAIISTNQGVVTDKKARELQVGGEVLAYICLLYTSDAADD